MSYSELLNQLNYDNKILKELEEEKRQVEKHLELLDFKIAELKGYNIRKVSGIHKFNESTLCRSCNHISSIVRDNLCYFCCIEKKI